MELMAAKDTASKVIAAVAAGAALAAAVSLVAIDEGRPPEAVLGDSKTTRYLVHNSVRAHPLCDNPPADVVCVPYRWDADGEARRVALLRDMGAHITALPSLLVWVDEETDGEGAVAPAHWEEVRLPEAWNDTPAPADRKRSTVRTWALSRNLPPPVLDGGPL